MDQRLPTLIIPGAPTPRSVCDPLEKHALDLAGSGGPGGRAPADEARRKYPRVVDNDYIASRQEIRQRRHDRIGDGAALSIETQ
jgi:hypothetical protein